MADYDNKGSFIFSKNDRKEKDTHPDLTGKLTDENGYEFYMNIWAKEKNGRRFFTGTLKAVEQQSGLAPTKRSVPLAEELSDDIPF